MIRQAKHADKLQLAWLVQEMFSEVGSEYGHVDRSAWTVEQVFKAVDNDEAVYIAEDERAIVGFCAHAHIEGVNEGECWGLGAYVRPKYRGDNLANKLRTKAEEHCRKKGYKTIMGEYSVGNVAIEKSLAKHSGVEIVGYTVRKNITKDS